MGKRVRDRWMHHVNPEIDHSQWRQEERDYLKQLQAQPEMENKWADIGRLFWAKDWRRTDNDIKNHANNMKLVKAKRSRTPKQAKRSMRYPWYEPASSGPAASAGRGADAIMPQRVLFQDSPART